MIAEINRYLLGWIGYFRLANTPSVFERLERWIRRRLRQMVWKRWKRGTTPYRELVKLGVPKWQAQAGQEERAPGAHACDANGPEQRLLTKLRAEEPEGSVSRTALCLMNRRMRTRMSGGVRGGG